MKAKTSYIYAYCTMFGGIAGYYWSILQKFVPYYDSYGEVIIRTAFSTVAGAAAGAGIAAVYLAGKKASEFYKKIFYKNKGGSLEKLVEK